MTHQIDPENVEQKLIDLDDRSRRNDLIGDGILEIAEISWEDCEEKLQQLLPEKLGLEFPTEIERAYRMSSRQNNMNNGDNPRTIICILLRYKDNIKFLQKVNKLKETNIFVNKNFSRETMGLRKRLWGKAHRE